MNTIDKESLPYSNFGWQSLHFITEKMGKKDRKRVEREDREKSKERERQDRKKREKRKRGKERKRVK